MRLHLAALGAVALLAACSKGPAGDAASGQSLSDQAVAVSDVQAPAALPSVADSPKPVAGPEFVATAAASDMYEVQAAKIALKRSHDTEVKNFARMMVADHTASTARIKQAIAESGQADALPAPKTLPDAQTMMLEMLTAAAVVDFDKTYIAQQLMAHQDALNLMTGYAKGGDVPTLKTAASEIAPKVQMHLDHAKLVQTHLGS